MCNAHESMRDQIEQRTDHIGEGVRNKGIEYREPRAVLLALIKMTERNRVHRALDRRDRNLKERERKAQQAVIDRRVDQNGTHSQQDQRDDIGDRDREDMLPFAVTEQQSDQDLDHQIERKANEELKKHLLLKIRSDCCNSRTEHAVIKVLFRLNILDIFAVKRQLIKMYVFLLYKYFCFHQRISIGIIQRDLESVVRIPYIRCSIFFIEALESHPISAA